MARKAAKSMLFDLVYFDHKQFISLTEQAHHINNYLNNELISPPWLQGRVEECDMM